MLKGRVEFRLGTERRVCGRGDVVVIPGGTEHEAWFPRRYRGDRFLRASARRLPTRWQTRLHERRLNRSLRLLTCRAANERVIFSKVSTHAGSAVTAQIASGLLEPTITA